MLTNKLTIVPVKLILHTNETFSNQYPKYPAARSGVIKTAIAEISYVRNEI